MAEAKGGLGKWFGEKWVDVKTGKACGRSSAEKSSRSYPACRPAAAAAKLTPKDKATMVARKTNSTRQKWPVSPSGKRTKEGS